MTSYIDNTIETYSSSSYDGSNQNVLEIDSNVDEDGTDDTIYDFASFLAQVSRSTAFTDWTSVAMNRIHITTSNVNLAEKRRQGSSFSVSLVNRERFSRLLRHGMANLNLPQLLAIKTPILETPLGSQKNKYIFDSMTREYQILNFKSLKNHENIVRLIGCCWRTVDMESNLTVPNLVLEGADLGDLEGFCRRHGGQISMRKRLGLCIDIALGLEALHLSGILHGDIKPQNILVFKNQNRGFIAKIADFGSSLPLYQSTFPRKACPGTKRFSAPELLNDSNVHSRDGLLQAEIYTLGPVFVVLVRGSHALDKLGSTKLEDIANLKNEGKFANWILKDEDPWFQGRMKRYTFGEDASEQERKRGIWHWYGKQEDNRLQALRAQGKIPSFDDALDDQDWITLRNDRLKREKSEMLFSDLVNRLLSVEPSRRPIDVHNVLQDLRQILTLELRVLYDPSRRNQMRYEEEVASSLRRLNPDRLHEGLSIWNLNRQEIDTIILNYFLDPSRTSSFVRDFYFIWRFGGISKFPARRRLPTRKHPLGLKCQRQKRYQASVAWYANKVKQYMKLVIRQWSQGHKKFNYQKWTDKGEIFQATLDERYTWLLSPNVRKEVIRQLQYIASSPRETESRRSLACFENALMALCYSDISKMKPELISRALHYVLQAANLGHHPAQSLVGRLFELFGHTLPIDRQKEIEWTFQVSLKGSLTAMNRLLVLSPAAHQGALHLIRFKYNGSFVEGEVWKDAEQWLFLITAGLVGVPRNLIHNLAAHGQLESLQRLSHLPHQTFNTQNDLGETPLMIACRSGHAHIVNLLLTLGADPSVGTFSNVHPLHFLSAFSDDDIPQITDVLLQHGAELDIHSKQGRLYRQGVDGRFGVEEGTPLLWSVVTGNLVAIRELLRHGADMFSYIYLDEWQMTNDVVIFSSPIEHAITMYRYDILDLLLSSCTNAERIKRGINDLRLVDRCARAAPLLYALQRRYLTQLRSTLVHGPNLHYAQLRMVEMLLRYGADPFRLSQERWGGSVHAIEIVCQGNNLLLLNFLWNHDAGKLRPSPSLYFKCIGYAVQNSNQDIFDFLLAHQHDIPWTAGTHKLELDLLAKLCTYSSDTYYMSTVINSMDTRSQQASSGATRRRDFTKPLFVALSAGNTAAAELLCQYGQCNFTMNYNNSLSMLAEIIILDAAFPIIKDRVGALLHLFSSYLPLASKRKIFLECASDNHGFKLTALQFAFTRQKPEPGTIVIPATAKPRILSQLLQAFNAPELLNYQVNPRSLKCPGDTALHMAARAGCFNEIEDLLDGPFGSSFELDIVNACNETLADVCIARHEELINEAEDRIRALGSLSTEGDLLSEIKDAEQTISSLVNDRRCSISVFSLLAIRASETLFLFVRRPNILLRVPYEPGIKFGKHLLSTSDHQDIVQLLHLEVHSLIPFVNSPSKYGKVLSKEMDDFIQKLV